MKHKPAAMTSVWMAALTLAGLVLGGSMPANAADPKVPAASEADARMETLIAGVRKQLVRLTEYGVFDYLWFGVTDKTIVLRDFASRPILKSSAAAAVKRVEGVVEVKNEIEVLPLGQNDDRIRGNVYARIFGNPALSKYTSNRVPDRFVSQTRRTMGITYDPPIGYHAIRIIVKNGEVTLYGVVDNSFDFTIAEVLAKGAPLTFGVFNELVVAKEDK